MEVFANKGYHGCRIADVAREANVAYGLVYHYFKNKEELLQSVFTESFGRFTRLIDEIASGEGSTEKKVEDIANFAIEAFRQDPRAVRVLILEIARSPAFRELEKRSAFVEAIRVTSTVIARGQEIGEVRPGLDPFIAACVLFGAIEVALTAFVLGNLDATNEEHIRKAKQGVVEIFLRGVAPAVQPPELRETPTAPAAKPEGRATWKSSRKSSTKPKAQRRS